MIILGLNKETRCLIVRGVIETRITTRRRHRTNGRKRQDAKCVVQVPLNRPHLPDDISSLGATPVTCKKQQISPPVAMDPLSATGHRAVLRDIKQDEGVP